MPEPRNEATICVTTDKIYADTMAQEDMQNPVPDSAIIIIDEIELDSLDVQLLLGILPSILKCRPDLKLILTSESFDAGRLIKHFSAFSPIQVGITGPGRHHLEHVYLEPGYTRSQDTRILQGLRSFFLDPFILTGDCLVFLKNEEEAYDTLNLCSRTLKHDHESIFKNVEFLTLTRDDPLGEFEIASTCRPADDGSGIKRKIIFATSIVASSITIPGIRLVMITGKNEVPRFDPNFRGTEMVTYQLSKGEIIQMCGRAGRTRSGTAMHLYHCKDSDKLA
jgi:HrpA-like RNA helicase